MEIITCKNLSVGYNGHPIRKNLNFSIHAGDYFCIVGENGCGKSTLMKTLLQLQPALEGEVVFADGLRKNEIGYLPQQTAVQRDFPASVKEIVLSGCLGGLGLRAFYGRREKALAAQAMERMGISSLAGRCYRELSGGQQQRVLLARALCAAKRVLLLDEPVSGLDPVATAELYQAIGELNAGDGWTVIMRSHDLNAALTCANRVLHLGDASFCGSVQEYMRYTGGDGRDC